MAELFLYSVQTRAALAINRAFYRNSVNDPIHWVFCSDHFTYSQALMSSPSYRWERYSELATTVDYFVNPFYKDHLRGLRRGARARTKARQASATINAILRQNTAAEDVMERAECATAAHPS